MPTTAELNSLATRYGTDAPYAALFSTAPTGSTAGTELTSSGYARQSCSWGTASGGQVQCTVTFTIASGVTVAGVGLYSASTAGTYIDGGSVTSQTFSSSGTYTVTITRTQTS